MLTPSQFYELVTHCDFDIEVTKEGKLVLIDLQGANLGGIEGEEFDTYASVLERMSVYLDDYFFKPLVECIEEDFKEWLGDCTYEEVVEWCDKNVPKSHGNDWGYHLRLVCMGAD